MKRMRITHLLAAMLLMLGTAACSKDDGFAPGTDDTGGEMQEFTFTVGMDYTLEGEDGTAAPMAKSIATRATATEDDKPTRCLMQVFDMNNNPVGEIQQKTGADNYTFTVKLVEGTQYTFCFWADSGTQEITDLTAVPYITETVAFAAKETGKPEDVAKNSVTLKHVVTKVTLETTTTIPANSTVSVTLPTCETYDVYKGETTGEPSSKSFSYMPTENIDGTTEGQEVFSFYALVKEGEQTVQISNGSSDKTVSVSLAPNRHVVLKGSAGVEGLDITNDGTNVTYTVSTPEALQAWAKVARTNGSLNCTLADNITLTGMNNWTPIGDISQPYNGTFDGAGHTISGLNIDSSDGYAGLIGFLSSSGIVKNLTVTNATIKAHPQTLIYVDGIIGYCQGGMIQGCGFSGSVSVGTATYIYAGGIVGFMKEQETINPSITACWSKATVAADATDVGGIAGLCLRTTLKACYYMGVDKGLGGCRLSNCG